MNGQPLNVLIVEGNQNLGRLFGLHATAAGFHYAVCDSEEKAIALVSKAEQGEQFNVAIVDEAIAVSHPASALEPGSLLSVLTDRGVNVGLTAVNVFDRPLRIIARGFEIPIWNKYSIAKQEGFRSMVAEVSSLGGRGGRLEKRG